MRQEETGLNIVVYAEVVILRKKILACGSDVHEPCITGSRYTFSTAGWTGAKVWQPVAHSPDKIYDVLDQYRL